MRPICLLLVTFLTAFAARAETYRLTLKQAIDRALAQNPEVMMARIDEMKASAGVRLAHSPFVPKVGVGSGLAYSNGFPLSIEGSAPAAFEAKATQALFNRPQSYAVAQAKEDVRSAGFAAGSKNDEIAFRVASLYVDADRAARLKDSAQKQVESLQKVLQTVQARVEEGRELPVTIQQANVDLLRARQRLITLATDEDFAGHNLAATLGYNAGDVVEPVDSESAALSTATHVPSTEDAALRQAFDANNELKRLQSSYEAKTLEIKGDRAQKLPKIDLVAQYALLTKYSHYDQYFAKFQRNNGQIGASIQIPLFAGTGVSAQISQSEYDQQHLRAEIDNTRSRIALDLHQSYLDIQKADVARDLAQADLDLARTELSNVLAQMNEGRATLRQVEEARFNEDEKWIAFYEAQFNTERTRLSILRQTGTLVASIQ
jgi:outer membrane protein TolC